MAIQRLADSHPLLVEKRKNGNVVLKIRFFQRTATTKRILGLSGGSGELKELIENYLKFSKGIKAPGKEQPVILLIDNDDGAKGIFGYAKNAAKLTRRAKNSSFNFRKREFVCCPNAVDIRRKEHND